MAEFRWKPRYHAVFGKPDKTTCQGVLITTSTFTKDASEFVEAMPQRIVLIDGKHLAALIVEHDVGVSATRTCTLKRLDQDYFENL